MPTADLRIQTALFVPGDRPDRLTKALGSGADVVIADLEDAVAPEAKEAARQHVRQFCAEAGSGGPLRWVRVNSDTAFSDMTAVVGPGLHALMLPKCASAAEVHEKASRLIELERRLGLAPATIGLVPLIETALGVLNAVEIARAPRVLTLAFGSLDYGLDVGLPQVTGGEELLFPRTQLVLAARIAGVQPPLDGVWANVRDADGTEADARRAHALGMGGKLAVHPTQIAPIRAAFTPSAAELEWAQQVVEAFAAASAQGQSVVRVGDRFIDPPVVKHAQRLLKRAADRA